MDTINKDELNGLVKKALVKKDYHTTITSENLNTIESMVYGILTVPSIKKIKVNCILDNNIFLYKKKMSDGSEKDAWNMSLIKIDSSKKENYLCYVFYFNKRNRSSDITLIYDA